MKDQQVVITGPATDTVPGDCDSVMILRRGVVSEIRPILLELTPIDESEATAMAKEFDAAPLEYLRRCNQEAKK